MSGFSTRSEDTILRKIDVTIPSMHTSEDQLIEKYDLSKCVSWIIENKFEKVCLQFPDSLLSDSVGISLWLEKQIEKKLYILGDTSYGSCCVDEVAAEHVKADGIIHFGHSCLSPTSRLPVLYIFPKCSMNVTNCISVVKEHCVGAGSTSLLIFDVGYDHYRKAVQDELSEYEIVIAEPLISNNHVNFCSKNCCLRNGMTHHSIIKLGRGYCLDDSNIEVVNVIFIGPRDSRFLYNYRISFTGSLQCYTENGTLENITVGKSLQRRFYLVERLKDAKTVGIIVGTLGIRGYLDTIKRVSDLIRRKGKKCYVISVGKPTIAKLANFSEIEIYVMISCPEAIIENEKEFYQPILSVMEAEFALNEGRSWSGISSSDFRDILPGAKHYVELPENNSIAEPDVSLISNKIRYNADNLLTLTTGSEQDGTVQLRADMTVDNASSSLANRSWQGLDPMLGQVPVVKAVQGRSGIAQAYSEEQSS